MRQRNPFFPQLGQLVLEKWTQEKFSLEAFPAIAKSAIEEMAPFKNVDLQALLRDFLENDEQPAQTNSGFGQPELIVFDHPHFYIQLLFWMEATTDIHQHVFSGAFHVLSGSSIHAQFEFHDPQMISSHFKVGNVQFKQMDLLETGRTVEISSGPGFIHSLFHLESPSVTLVVRTHKDPGTSPQFNYLPPHIAFDPEFNDPLTYRRRQLLDVLEAGNDPDYVEIVKQMIKSLDFERGFYILDQAMNQLEFLGEWEHILEAFKQQHGALASGIATTLDEGRRRAVLSEYRSSIVDPDHRFFLALLMNLPSQEKLLELVTMRFPHGNPVDTLLEWTKDLLEIGDSGVCLLDAEYPEFLETPQKRQAELLIGVLRGALEGEAAPLTTPQKEIFEALSRSCLRILLV